MEVDSLTSLRMSRIRQRGTKAETLVRKSLRSLGWIFRMNVRSLPGSPDMANKRRKTAVFVNGCFWHHHTGCQRATTPKHNRQFWLEKFLANRSRDSKSIRALRATGYKVLLIWECETLDMEALSTRLLKALGVPRQR